MGTHEIAPPKELKDSSGLIVGGTAGIGLATAVGLAQAGAPRIMIVGRNPERGQIAAERISSANSSCEVTFLSADATTVDGAAHIASESARPLAPSTPPRPGTPACPPSTRHRPPPERARPP